MIFAFSDLKLQQSAFKLRALYEFWYQVRSLGLWGLLTAFNYAHFATSSGLHLWPTTAFQLKLLLRHFLQQADLDILLNQAEHLFDFLGNLLFELRMIDFNQLFDILNGFPLKIPLCVSQFVMVIWAQLLLFFKFEHQRLEVLQVVRPFLERIRYLTTVIGGLQIEDFGQHHFDCHFVHWACCFGIFILPSLEVVFGP